MTHYHEKSQIDRFKEAAREIEADQSEGALDKALGKLHVKRKPEPDEKSGE